MTKLCMVCGQTQEVPGRECVSHGICNNPVCRISYAVWQLNVTAFDQLPASVKQKMHNDGVSSTTRIVPRNQWYDESKR